jgi:hypothetical protein
MKLFFTFLFAILCAVASAQTKVGHISGLVTDDNQKPIEGATVSLLKSKDAALVKVAVTDKKGTYEFDKIAEGEYVLSITVAGFQKKNSPPFSVTPSKSSVSIDNIQMAPAAKSLGEVTVTGKRPLIENKIDRTVINVDAAPTNSGATAMEVLEKSPGISVDNDGNISLKGKQGVIVMMDGKPTYLSATDLAAVLRNMPASALDQIEIMTNPPAKYDASGNSGIINIKTKKSRNEGFNGSITAGGTMGFYNRGNSLLTPVRSSESLNMNYRKGKINLFGSLNYNYNENKSDLELTRKLYDSSGKPNITSNQATIFNGRNNNYTMKVGMDFYKSKKTVFGFVFNGFAFFGHPQNNSSQVLTNSDGTTHSVLESVSGSTLQFANYSGNLNYKHTFDSAGTELSVDLDYIGYSNSTKSQLTTETYDAVGGPKTGTFQLNGNIPSYINIYSAKTDYTHPLNKSMRFDAGAKFSYVDNNNEVGYLNFSNGDWVKDDRSNHFIYQENINAAYASINRKWNKFSAQAGLRLENTISKGHQVTNDSTFTRNYTSLFPTVFLSYDVNKNNNFTLSFGRRINRPNYQDLNPFIWFLDSLTYRIGNPYLLPQYAYNFELRHSYKNGLTTTLNYTITDDVISQLLKQDELITYLTPDNVARQVNMGIAINAPVKPFKWWNMNLFGNVFNNHYTGVIFNSIKNANDPIDLQYTSFMLNVTNNFNFKKGWSAELSGWYRGKTIDQLTLSDPMYFMVVGGQKTMLKGNGTLRMNFRDPFAWQKFSGHTQYSYVDVNIKNRWNNRAVNVSFTYRFGKSSVQQARRRTTGATEEDSRTGGGN